MTEGKDFKEYLDSLKKKSNQKLSLEIITRTWLEQYAVKKSLDEETKSKRIRKFENHVFPKATCKACRAKLMHIDQMTHLLVTE